MNHFSKFMRDATVAGAIAAAASAPSEAAAQQHETPETQTVEITQDTPASGEDGEKNPGKIRRAMRRYDKAALRGKDHQINNRIVAQGFENYDKVVLGAENKESKFLAAYQDELNKNRKPSEAATVVVDPAELTAALAFANHATTQRITAYQSKLQSGRYNKINPAIREEVDSKVDKMYADILTAPPDAGQFDLVAGSGQIHPHAIRGIGLFYNSQIILSPSYDNSLLGGILDEKTASLWVRLHETYHTKDSKGSHPASPENPVEYPYLSTADEMMTDLCAAAALVRSGQGSEILEALDKGDRPDLPLLSHAPPGLLGALKDKIDGIGVENFRQMSDADISRTLSETISAYHVEKTGLPPPTAEDKAAYCAYNSATQAEEVYADLRACGDMVARHGFGMEIIDKVIAVRTPSSICHATAPALETLKQKILALDPDPEKAIERFKNINNGTVDDKGQPVEGITAEAFYRQIVNESSLSKHDIAQMALIEQNAGRTAFMAELKKNDAPRTDMIERTRATIGDKDLEDKDDFESDEFTQVRKEMLDAAFEIGQDRSKKIGINMLTLREARDKMIDKFMDMRERDPENADAYNRQMRLIDLAFIGSTKGGINFTLANAERGMSPRQTAKMEL